MIPNTACLLLSQKDSVAIQLAWNRGSKVYTKPGYTNNEHNTLRNNEYACKNAL